MNISNKKEDLLESIVDSLKRIEYFHPDKMPNIDLYVDQVTTFMEEALAPTKRYEDDKIMTKTMINNYSKINLLPPSTKKKYSKEHLLTLFFIYYFKNVLSIQDLNKLLNPLTDRYFKNEDGMNMEEVYKEVFSLEDSEVQSIIDDLCKKYDLSLETFTDAKDEEKEMLQRFSFICMLSYDVFVRKLLIEKLIDNFLDESEKK